MRKLALFLLLIFTFVYINTFPVRANDDLPGEIHQIVCLKKDSCGDLLCFDVTVAKSNAKIKYRTIGWIIKINNIGIIYKYLASESNSETFSFRLTDLENEYKRQYGENTNEYKSVINALYVNGGTITFDAINTVSENGALLGSITDNPVYGKPDTHNYRGEVYDTLTEIVNARNWSSRTKEVDLPKYYGIRYNFSPQPHVDGLVNINFINSRGNKIRNSITIEKKFAVDDEPLINYTLPVITGYGLDEWRIFHNGNEINRGYSSHIQISLSKDTPVLTVDAIYSRDFGRPDLKIVDVSPDTYTSEAKVLTVVRIRNDGVIDFGPDNPVDIKVTINNKVYTRKIDIGRNKEIIVPFVWETPNEGNVLIDAEVNHNRKHDELNYDNNRMVVSVKINKFLQPVIGETTPVELVPPPEGKNECYKEWKEWRFSHFEYSSGGKRPIYVEKLFWIRLNINSFVDKQSLKSGYGFGLVAPVKVETNYDKPEFIIPPQRVLVYLPETRYSAFLMLEESKTGNFSSTWTLPVNTGSIMGNKYHYVPVWFPDKTYYHMNVTAIDSYCPGGELSATTKAKLWIDGNMYQDDYIGRIY